MPVTPQLLRRLRLQLMVSQIRRFVESGTPITTHFFVQTTTTTQVGAIKSRGTLNNVRYLSSEWISEADKRVKGLTPLSTGLVVKYQVVDGPDGDRSYNVVFGPDEMAVLAEHPDPNVVLSLPWDCATSIATGTISAQRAFLDGTINLSGDAVTLIGHQEVFSDVMDVLSDLRDRTEYA